MAKVIGIIGSPRRGGNTEIIMQEALKVCQSEGLETELVHLAELNITPCQECLFCKKAKECKLNDDFPPLFEKLVKAQGIILAAPVFFGSAPAQMKAFIDRAGYLGIARDRPFERKVGGALVVARRAGQNFTLAQLLYFFLYHGMVVPGSTYWNVAFGRDPGEVWRDEEGLRTVRNFARNLSWLIKMLY
ncbi:MAG: hypothetical protein PWP65_708 [Clostridia bacterium]|nr:hypothetical protein [Clostridia bacterium]